MMRVRGIGCLLRPVVAASLLCALVVGMGTERAQGAEPDRKNLWEGAIKRFEAADAEAPPAPGGIVFVGSSSIRLWDLKKSFPDLPALNRGFGGSQLSDSVELAERLVIKHRPRLVLLYAGDNDLPAGKSPERIRDDFKAFVAKVHATLPDTKVVYLAIKPSLARWRLIDAQRQANALIEAETKGNPRLLYLDVATPLLGADGMPRAEYYVADGLHLSPAGYDVWAERVGPVLTQP
jgi:lysophospholipase L1-like esterase